MMTKFMLISTFKSNPYKDFLNLKSIHEVHTWILIKVHEKDKTRFGLPSWIETEDQSTHTLVALKSLRQL